jgi:hypothetical protein
MTQGITDEEKRLAANPPVEDDLGEDIDAIPADEFDQERKDPDLLIDEGGFESVLGDDLQELDLNQPGPESGEEV